MVFSAVSDANAPNYKALLGVKQARALPDLFTAAGYHDCSANGAIPKTLSIATNCHFRRTSNILKEI
jgi:hypothetical protein